MAVQVSSGMENRQELGNQLKDFGNKIRDVKDAMGKLHSKGITTFQWALHRVSVSSLRSGASRCTQRPPPSRHGSSHDSRKR